MQRHVNLSQLGGASCTFCHARMLQHPRRQAPRQRHHSNTRAAASFGESIKRVARQVQGALPIVGLLSRLTSPSGGIGKDMLSYPEFCRATFDLAPDNFLTICAELEKAYGVPASRKYILLYLWEAREGGGIVSSKLILGSARRLRVTQDLEIEMDRFGTARAEIAEKYSYLERPRGKPQEQIDIAVDALSRLIAGIPDADDIPEPACSLMKQLIAGAWADVPEAEELVETALATRQQRAQAYAA